MSSNILSTIIKYVRECQLRTPCVQEWKVFLQVLSTPCKCCSSSQQRSSPGLRLRLTVPLVLTECVWWMSHCLITYFALDIWHSTFHSPVVEETARPHDICQVVVTARFPSDVLQQFFECLPQPLPDITYLRKTWIQSVWVRKTLPWRKRQQAHTWWHRWRCCRRAVAAACRGFLFHEPLVSRLSEIRPIPMVLTEGSVEELVDPSTWTNQNKFEPWTSDRDYLSSLVVPRSYIRILPFVRHVVFF